MKLTPILLLPFIVACSAQNYAGITKADFTFNDDGQLKTATIVDGKESAEKAWAADLSKGKLEYNSSDVKAFEGQKARAEVHKILLSEVPDVADSLTDKIMSVLAP